MERRTNTGRPRRSTLPRCLAGAALILAGLGTMAGNHSPVQAQSAGPDPASMVNPFIGTSGSVDDFPGADAPFGMMQWSPDTPQRPAGGGYEYNDSAITGFSLDHISGPGCGAMGDVPILPWLGSIPTTPETSPGSLVQPFQHSSETAQPGYYAVTLDQPQAMPSGIRTELTVTPRSGLGRFTFPSSTQSNLLINLDGSANGTFAASAAVTGTNEVIGSIQSGHFCGAGDVYTLYFSLQFNRPFSAFGTWNGSTLTPGSRQASGGSSGVYVTFNTSSQPAVLAKVGISYVSVSNALHNAATEDPGWNFDSVRQAGYHSWDNLLGKIRITGGTASEQQIFYTALYHSLLHPNIFSDVNGQYPGFDNKVHTLASGQTAQYANFSGWDIYRSQVQLLAMLDPAVGSDVAQSMVNDYSQDAMLPKWALNNGESYVMVGDPADPILAGLYAFGATHFNTGAALQDMVAEASRTNNIRPGLNYYLAMHYEPDNGQYGCCNFYGSASTTLEYTTADEAIGQFASALGNAGLAQTFYHRAQNWEYLFDPSTSLIRPKELNGQFMTPFVPENFETGGYVEGDGYQYTPMVPYNLHALATAMGGRAAYVKYLDGLFALFGGPDAPLAEPSNYAFTQSIFGGMAVPFSWQGNEPATEIPWEYDAVGAPYRTQDVVRRIALYIYSTQPDGLPGNDDLGEMSSWYVWAALGMYPETPGSAFLDLGSPLFTSETITLGSGHTLSIQAPAASDTNRYVQSMTVNGSSWGNAYLPPSIVHNGGTISVALGPNPNPNWGIEPQAAPPSIEQGELPALGYTLPSGIIPAAPAAGFKAQLGVRNVEDSAVEVVYWTAHPGAGITVTPSSGTLVAPAGGDATTPVTVTPAPGTSGETVTFSLRTQSGQTLPSVVDVVGSAGACVTTPSAPPTADSLAPFYNNAGISNDCNDIGNFDDEAYSFSQQALGAAGLVPGKPFNWNGLKFTWPSVGAGQPDNVVASGQTIPLSAPSGATTIGFLGSAGNGPVDGSAIITYTDGTQQTIDLGFSDWTLGAGSSKPSYGNQIVATTRYRNFPTGPQTVNTYIFGARFALTKGKTPLAITLPAPAGLGTVHIFAMAFG